MKQHRVHQAHQEPYPQWPLVMGYLTQVESLEMLMTEEFEVVKGSVSKSKREARHNQLLCHPESCDNM